MRCEAILGGRKIIYELRKSVRSRRLSIAVGRGGSVRVTVPKRLTERDAAEFLRKKALWVISSLEKMEAVPPGLLETGDKRDYSALKEKARALISERVEFFSGCYGYKPGKISISNQSTRWGSCSKNGNLNFNYKLIKLSEECRDYIIVHELCHLKEFNHSDRFWKLVGKAIPDYKKIRKKLKES